MSDVRALGGRHRPELMRVARSLGSPVRDALDRRLTALASRIEGVQAATHEEGAANRAATATLSESINDHMQAVIEATSHLGARVEQALQTLERIEARLAQDESTTVDAARHAGE
jgi:hypothetical protein